MSIPTLDTSSTSTQSHLLAIPKLDENGLNFIAWKARAKSSFEARRLWKHVEGRVPRPDSLIITTAADGSVKHTRKDTADTSEVTQKVIDDFEAKCDDWNQKQALIRAQLFASIPNSLLIEIQGLENASRMWDAIELIRIREVLAGRSFSGSLFVVTATDRTLVAPDQIISLVREEIEHREITRRQQTGTADAALTARWQRKGKFKRSEKGSRGGTHSEKSQDSEVICWNCDKPGHIKAECRGKGGGDEGNGQKRSQRRNWNGKSKKSESANSTQTETKLEDVHLLTATVTAEDALSTTIESPDVREEVYDTGATRHMCPHRDMFETYVADTKHVVRTAEKDAASLDVVGRGDVRVRVPNGDGETTILLTNVIHCPGMACTLVSIGLIDEAGYSATFRGGVCLLADPSRKVIAEIPKINGRAP